MTEDLLRIENLRVALPMGADRQYAVSDVTLSLQPNEILCVVGESGSGKSVMARSVMGLLPKRLTLESGNIHFDSEDLTTLPETRMRDIRGTAISMIFQEPMTALNPLMTIGSQIDEVLIIYTKLPKNDRRERVLEALEDVRLPEPSSIINAYPHEISGGQRQRAMIAMALILEPKIIIADEPTTALDVTTEAQILKLIKDLQTSHGTGVLFITHDFGVVAEISDRIAIMKDGELVETGTNREILNSPQHPYTKKLIAAVPDLAPRRPGIAAETPSVLEVKELSKTYIGRGGGLLSGPKRDVVAVNGVSFDLRRGETLGLVGESGSGKSTVARCIVRLIESQGGEIKFGDRDILKLSSEEMRHTRPKLQMIFQDPYGSLNPRLTVGQMIAQGPIIHGTDKTEAYKLANELLELVGLDARATKRYPHEFSGGQRQRIGIARALALKPEIIVADEAVSALDVSVQAQVLGLLADIRERFELSMLFITHDLRVAAQVCDSIAVMQRGEIVEYGKTIDVFHNPSHAYTQELLDAVPGRDWRHS
jgi:peptide/nickel transport system ATP-binding protein